MFMPRWLTEPNPTLSTVARAIREGGGNPSCTRAEVLAAAKERGVPVVNSRVSRDSTANLFFATNLTLNEKVCAGCGVPILASDLLEGELFCTITLRMEPFITRAEWEAR